jgi:hypothetical protein
VRTSKSNPGAFPEKEEGQKLVQCWPTPTSNIPMAPKITASSTRSLFELFHPTRRRPAYAKCNQLRQSRPTCPSRNVSTAAPQQSEMEVDHEERPRWAFTPPAMAAPVRTRLPRREAIWRVNEDPQKLDSFYIRFLGPGGDKLLTDETKWLAITHKSFDHGRRGFNDRLSYLGKHAIIQRLGGIGFDCGIF